MDELTKTVFAATADQRRLLDAVSEQTPTLRLLEADDPVARMLAQAHDLPAPPGAPARGQAPK